MATQQLTEILKDQSGVPMSAGGQLPAVWESSNAAVVTVDQTGLASTVGPAGSANITAKRYNANGVLITSAAALINVVLSSMLRYAPGDSVVAKGGTFARTSVGRRMNAGLRHEEVASGTIRDTHFIGAQVTTLIEPMVSTNYTPYSIDASNAVWAVGAGCTKTVEDNANAPFIGASAVATFQEDASTGGHYAVIAAGSAPPGNAWAQSLDVRPKNGARYCALSTFDTGFNYKTTVFDCTGNGAIISNTHASGDDPRAFIYPIADGFYRIGVRRIGAAPSGHEGFQFAMRDNPAGPLVDSLYTGNSTRRWNLFGAQNEGGETWTELIPNLGAGSAVRSADVLVFPWPHDPSVLFSVLLDAHEVGGGSQGEGSKWSIGREYPNAHIFAYNISFNYGFTYTFQGGGAGGASGISGPVAPFHARVESIFRWKAAAMDMRSSINQAAETGFLDSAHGGVPATWGTGGLRIGTDVTGSRPHKLAIRKLIIMAGNVSTAVLRSN